VITTLKLGIKSIYDRLGTEEDLLGITESNLMDYLGIIEQRTIELLKMYQSCINYEHFEEKKKPSQGGAAKKKI